jgi:glycosyltransferase involved in cell wall biosynthesis
VQTRILIVSPVRNEAAHIERVVRAVAAQELPPARWIVVDDGSDDGTRERLEELAAGVPFMRVVATPPDFTAAASGDRLAAAAAPRAFNFGLAAAGGPDGFTHIGKLDGDTELPPDYFERLLDEFRANPRLGIGGGIRLEREGDRWQMLPIPRTHVPGALKLYTRECFAAIGGMLEILGWDAVDETYARMRGYETASFPALQTWHHRPWGTADGRLRGRVRYGHSSYVARQGALWVTLKSAKVARMPPRGLSGVAFLYGYVRAWARSAPRIEDPQFARFVQRELRGRLVPFGWSMSRGARQASS